MTKSIILMLLGLLGLLGFVWWQSDISSAVITLRLSFSPRLDRDSMVLLALYVGDSTLWFFVGDV
jgi:TRAP-type C4-dicarboxylate transport system permease small subunit